MTASTIQIRWSKRRPSHRDDVPQLARLRSFALGGHISGLTVAQARGGACFSRGAIASPSHTNFTLDCAPNPFWGQRQLESVDASLLQRVEHRINNRCWRTIRTGLATAFGSQGIVRTRFAVVKLRHNLWH